MTLPEEILSQPDITTEFDADDVVATDYRATVTRTGKQWTATVRDLPEGHAVQAQGSTWSEVGQNVTLCIVDLLQAAPGTVAVQLVPADSAAADALAAVKRARYARVLAEQAERDATRAAARTLIGQGWTTRDAGSAMGLSHQTISKLTSGAAVDATA
ncbi:hypothetical protein [Planomonospora sp. ID82291]|uniref:hypothetical protein n=1 Tax=Planomonospora sp. ID82291 TaxID=2738136 RepID=UPI0018C39E00|nr:hypothetical protein [Planomonospora sp. ID82291]MBG0818916.1 hypothetical protein [Planomonospora sp. ID82291]